MSVRSSKPIRPFTIGVPESGLADLRERLARARWEPEPAGGAEGLRHFQHLGARACGVLEEHV
jgi:hypothetical protein